MKTFYFENYQQFLLLNSFDKLLLQDFTENGEEKFYGRITQDINLNNVIKLSEHDGGFATFCKSEKLKNYWMEQWKLFGLYLSKDKQSPIAFYAHKENCHFTLLKGAFFYHQSQLNRNDVNQDFLYSEKQFLLKAIEYGSVHAVQRYNQYLYQTVNESKDSAETKKVFASVIKNCQALVKNYGSYALMMQCEVYIKYCEWLINSGNKTTAQKFYQAAIQCCETAHKVMDTSRYSIYNASLGAGLSQSNSQKIDDPTQARSFLTKYLLPKLETPVPEGQTIQRTFRS